MDNRQEIAVGIARLEDHLICQAKIRNARAKAEAFTDRMQWLTSAQCDEIVRLYTDARIGLSRSVLRRIADRCRDLQAEYTIRYEQLRQRLGCVFVGLMLGALFVCGCLLLLAGNFHGCRGGEPVRLRCGVPGSETCVEGPSAGPWKGVRMASVASAQGRVCQDAQRAEANANAW